MGFGVRVCMRVRSYMWLCVFEVGTMPSEARCWLSTFLAQTRIRTYALVGPERARTRASVFTHTHAYVCFTFTHPRARA